MFLNMVNPTTITSWTVYDAVPKVIPSSNSYKYNACVCICILLGDYPPWVRNDTIVNACAITAGGRRTTKKKTAKSSGTVDVPSGFECDWRFNVFRRLSSAAEIPGNGTCAVRKNCVITIGSLSEYANRTIVYARITF